MACSQGPVRLGHRHATMTRDVAILGASPVLNLSISGVIYPHERRITASGGAPFTFAVVLAALPLLAAVLAVVLAAAEHLFSCSGSCRASCHDHREPPCVAVQNVSSWAMFNASRTAFGNRR